MLNQRESIIVINFRNKSMGDKIYERHFIG